ncbi:MAG: hypothetical protein HY560_11640 [Gemmatimonadetes bacterium]|nr:hypothetical protein [Gemmatimonadota bacterium]
MGDRLRDAMARTLERVLGEKDRFEYQGYVATPAEAEMLFRKSEQFATWAESVLASTRRTGD